MSYEPKHESHEFIGVNRSDAVGKACAFFEIAEDALNIKELGPDRVAGIGDRVLVIAEPQDAPKRPPQREGRGSDREARGRDREPRGREGRGRDREGRGRERESRGRDREGRGRDREGRGRDREGRGRERSQGSDRERSAPEPIEPEGDSVGSVQGEIGAIGTFVQGIVERMDLGSFEISESQDGDLTVVELTGPAARQLRATDGRPSEGIQLLANQVAARSEEHEGRVVIDVEGDQAQREGVLERAADRAAKRALDSGRAVALEPMNAKDRRIVHVALRDTEDIATMSIGEGRYRQVVVVPEGAPEYEEARGSERASERD
jgi:spoIIIJ-associated protein